MNFFMWLVSLTTVWSMFTWNPASTESPQLTAQSAVILQPESSTNSEASSPLANVQTDALFTPLAQALPANATPAQVGRLRTLQAAATTASVELIRINLGALQNDTTLISLPGAGSIAATRRKTIVRSAS